MICQTFLTFLHNLSAFAEKISDSETLTFQFSSFVPFAISFKNACQDDPQTEEATGYVIPAKAGIQANSVGNKPGFPPARE
jgi:hypothetical protein